MDIASRSGALDDLFEAYDDASTTLDRLKAGRLEADPAMVDEYRKLSLDIESDVLEAILSPRFGPLR